MAWNDLSGYGGGFNVGSDSISRAARLRALMQSPKTDLLDKSKLPITEQGLPTTKGWFDINTGQEKFGYLSDLASDKNVRFQEMVDYPNDMAREKIQSQWSQQPLQYTTNPDGTVTAERTMNSPYNVDGISRGQALTHKWVLPKKSIGAGIEQRMTPETDAQRSMMYDRGGAYSNMSTRVSPFKMGSSSFRLPTVQDGKLARFGGVTNYQTGQQVVNGGTTPIGLMSYASFQPAYQRFRGSETQPFDINYNHPPAPEIKKKTRGDQLYTNPNSPLANLSRNSVMGINKR